MKELNDDILREAASLINQLRSGTLNEDEISAVVTQLRRLLPDPNFMAYAVDQVPELAAEEVVRKAFLYRAIQL